MLIALLLALAAQPTPAPVENTYLTFEHAGFVHDTHLALPEVDRLVFHARVDWPAASLRRTFLVRALDAEGQVLLERRVVGCIEAPRGRHKRARLVGFTLTDSAFVRAREVHVALAD